MFIQLRLVGVMLLLLLNSRLFADEPPPQEAPPPTAEEIKEAVEKFCKFFSWIPLPPAQPVKQPDWHPLEPEDAKRVDEVLAAWRKSRAQSGGFRCQFKKWEYDPVFGSRDGKTPARYSEGEYRTDAADVWMFRELRSLKPVVSCGKTDWIDGYCEHWARNKSSLYEYDYRSKRVIERRFPEDATETPVAIGLFGFEVLMFGDLTACYELPRLEPVGLQERFWVRPTTALYGSKDSWLELVPKMPRDARLFSSLIVVISEGDSEIRALDIRASRYSAQTNPAHTSIDFFDRKKSTTSPSVIAKLFSKSDSCVPSVPAGWKKVVEDLRLKK